MEEPISSQNSAIPNIQITEGSSPKKKKWILIIFGIIIILLIVPAVIGYNYYNDLRNLRIDETFTFIAYKCFNYCEPKNDSFSHDSECATKCIDINTKGLHERGGYTTEFKKKHTIYDVTGLNLCPDVAHKPIEERKCFEEQVKKYEKYFKDLAFKEV